MYVELYPTQHCYGLLMLKQDPDSAEHAETTAIPPSSTLIFWSRFPGNAI